MFNNKYWCTIDHVATEDEGIPATDIGCCCTTPIVQLKSDVLETESLSLLTGDT